MPSDEASLERSLLQNGCVALYHNPFLLEEHSNSLALHGWRIREMYAADSGTADEFFEQAAAALDFPSFFGRNLDAFRDCLGEISFPESGRLALWLTRFDLVANHDAQFAHAVLDICAGLERHWLMTGRRILYLVQSSDPDLRFPPVGAMPVLWNIEEWLDSKRRERE